MLYKPTWTGLLLIAIFALSQKTNIAQKIRPRPYEKSKVRNVMIELPNPAKTGSLNIEQAISKRRSVRSYRNLPLKLEQISQLLWAAQGITSDGGYRSTPSAGALYPLELYVVATNVDGLETGIYKFDAKENALRQVKSGNFRDELMSAGMGQDAIESAPATVVFAGVHTRTQQKYGPKASRYVHMEVGHASQNIYLQATALNLGTVAIGAFSGEAVKRVIGMPPDEKPLYLMPVGAL
ncbi:SagB/ThcOx family dehydrogenase [Candidatus Dependentiae bacterium]